MSTIRNVLKRSRGEGAGDDSEKGKTTYKQKVLVLSSRGISQRQRHLMGDVVDMLPHAKKDSKLDTKHQLSLINELSELNNCNNALYFEARRKFDDLYLWAAKTPNGPSVRFHVVNIHTMDELKMTGNSLKGSRPIVVFDSKFDAEPHLRIIKTLLTHTFAVPKSARRVKPFIDHVISFSLCDGKIWFRNYQILEGEGGAVSEGGVVVADALAKTGANGKKSKKEPPQMSLNEIGPRFVLTPVKIFEGAFNGATVYENESFVPASVAAAEFRAEKAHKYKSRHTAQQSRKVRQEEMDKNRQEDPLEVKTVFQ